VSLRRRFDWIDLLFAVGLVAVSLYMLAPIIFVVINSFNSAAYNVFPPAGFSLRWYENALSVPKFRTSFTTSVMVALGAMTVSLVFGTMAARALTRHRFRGQTFLRSFFFAPVLVPRIALGAALFLLYIRIGMYGGVPGLIIAHSLLGLPFVISIMTAVMYNIDPTQEEAAQDLGCGPIESFFRVTLAQLRTGLVVAGVFAFMMSFDELETSLFLVRPENNTLPIEMFLYVQEFQNPTLAALSSLLILLTVVLVLVLVPVLRARETRRLVARQ
jgi:putative spermidine/putrescine transport system permease protein